ncbi:hypothetical protein OIU84_020973 [Salix udensis]|uniref:Uncharacterized protein n=1 Tax=Salix udensis TaxID=889485 RepID=A0AAD6KTK6_9ROSI|nr:hypothetical protein OIU84_020973 [Salix udensis]
MEDDDSVDPINKPKQEEESEAEEDPEEDPEESEEMEDPEEYEQMDDPGHDSSNEAIFLLFKKRTMGKTSRMLSMSLWLEMKETGQRKQLRTETDLKDAEAVIDKELLEAFRFFDWNQNWLHQGLRHEVDYTQLGKISFPRGGQGENCASVSSQLPP